MLQQYWQLLQPYLQYVFLGNTLGLYLWVIIIIIIGFALKYIFVYYVARKLLLYLNRQKLYVQPEQINYFIKKPIGLFLNLAIFYNAVILLSFPKEWYLAPDTQWGIRMILSKSYEIVLITSFTFLLLQLTNLISSLLIYKAEKTADKTDNQIIYFMKELVKVLIVLFAFFFVLSKTFNLNVTSILAGLGIGGLAVALAGKETIENLFASFTIFLDKPFVVGDFVQINQIQGTIERVGFRSTRIRTLDQTYLTLPNKMLIDNPLDNFTQRTFRRARFSIHIPLDTPAEKIKALTQDIRQLLDSEERSSKLDRMCVWNTFADYSFEILIIFFLDIPDFMLFHEAKQEFNFKILEILDKHQVRLTYPTQILHLQQDKHAQS